MVSEQLIAINSGQDVKRCTQEQHQKPTDNPHSDVLVLAMSRWATDVINMCMKIAEVVTQPSEAKAPEKLCKSRVPDDQLGASQLASCKSQGLRARDSGDSYTIGGKKTKLRNKKIRGKKYGGPIPAHGKKNKANAKKGSH